MDTQRLKNIPPFFIYHIYKYTWAQYFCVSTVDVAVHRLWFCPLISDRNLGQIENWKTEPEIGDIHVTLNKTMDTLSEK